MASVVGSNQGVTQASLPIFGGENYEFWKIKMRTLLIAQGLWSIVEGGYTEPPDESQLTNAEKEMLNSNRTRMQRHYILSNKGCRKFIFENYWSNYSKASLGHPTTRVSRKCKDRAWRAKAPLELVHTDICGKMQTASLSQNRRGEYTSKNFDKFCEDEGIHRQLTAAYSPQQNGIAERKNRTIVEMARSMLKEKGLPNEFWAEAVNTAVYIQNRCPTNAVKNKTPLEAWTRTKPMVSHLKIFGCMCYAHIPVEKRKKIDDKSAKCVFVGYSNSTKGYRLYDVETKN
uniref:Integrase catalytic domain-containing protein n=1 Tax=Ananas comosus var. bracteatus TaxID=296719 RepID=A0A6V7QA78_ANACO|nr:unnamed protein product [Ananas comosus var. bracteatus]